MCLWQSKIEVARVVADENPIVASGTIRASATSSLARLTASSGDGALDVKRYQ